MIYVITEDSNSARTFWIAVFTTFLEPDEFEIGDLLTNAQSGKTSGNTTLKKQAGIALNKLKSGDTLFVAFDNVNSNDTFCVADFLHNLVNMCKTKNIDLIYTKYYCFEEMYLGYDGLINMYREYVKNSLLTKVTRELKGYFTISKRTKSFGKCWYLDCQKLQQDDSDKHILFFCNHCKYCCKNTEAPDKLRDVILCEHDTEILQLLQLDKVEAESSNDLQSITKF